MPRRLVLVGFMGSGKSTVGPLVAERLGFEFVDLDARIEERTGMEVARIFQERGEAAFREAERHLAAEIAEREDCVVAAGGGAFAEAATREVLRADAFTVWLRCGLDTVLSRIASDPARPLATSRERIALLFAARDSNYALADAIVSTDRASPDQTANAVLALWHAHRERLKRSRVDER